MYTANNFSQLLVSKWPHLTIIGCRFHLRQSWYREIQQLGLQKTYWKSTSSTEEMVISEGGRWLRYVFGLIFLQPNEVHDAFIIQNIPPSLWASRTASLEGTANTFLLSHPSRYLLLRRKTHRMCAVYSMYSVCATYSLQFVCAVCSKILSSFSRVCAVYIRPKFLRTRTTAR